jgi:putative oxidoreductase
MSFVIGTVGPGRYSLDNVLKTNLFDGWKGLVVTVLGGLGGAIVLLATCWRPVPANGKP